jgi:hypothetical protein
MLAYSQRSGCLAQPHSDDSPTFLHTVARVITCFATCQSCHPCHWHQYSDGFSILLWSWAGLEHVPVYREKFFAAQPVHVFWAQYTIDICKFAPHCVSATHGRAFCVHELTLLYAFTCLNATHFVLHAFHLLLTFHLSTWFSLEYMPFIVYMSPTCLHPFSCLYAFHLFACLSLFKCFSLGLHVVHSSACFSL